MPGDPAVTQRASQDSARLGQRQPPAAYPHLACPRRLSCAAQDHPYLTQTTTEDSNDGYKQYRRTITTTKHYDAGAFVAPSGYTYTRYAIGQRVNGDLLGNDYVLSSYHNYALQAPPSGLTWIRVGDDALLVDRNTGEVVESDYGLFKN